MKNWIVAVLFLVLTSSALAQPPDTLWTRTFGGLYYDRFKDVQSTVDGGYIAVGPSKVDSAGHQWDMLAVKVDAFGQTDWARRFCRSSVSYASAVVDVEDGYLIVGYIYVDTTRKVDVSVTKLSSTGDSLWSRNYGGNLWDEARDAIQISDNEIAIAGYSDSYTPNIDDFDMWLLMINLDGDSLWSRSYRRNGFEQPFAITQTIDGGFALAGEADETIWLLKTNALGDSVWSHAYGEGEAYDVTSTSDGGFALVGLGNWASVYLIKADSLGNQQWRRDYGNGLQNFGSGVIQLPDGGYAVAGQDNPDVDVSSVWLLRTDANGDTLWSNRWSRGFLNSAYSVDRTSDGGFIMAGIGGFDNRSWRSGDAWLLKTAPDPMSASNPQILIPTEISLAAYPNPFNSHATIAFSLSKTSKVSIEVFDILGRNTRAMQSAPTMMSAGEHSLVFDGSGLASGIYFVRLDAGEFSQTRKMILLK